MLNFFSIETQNVELTGKKRDPSEPTNPQPSQTKQFDTNVPQVFDPTQNSYRMPMPQPEDCLLKLLACSQTHESSKKTIAPSDWGTQTNQSTEKTQGGVLEICEGQFKTQISTLNHKCQNQVTDAIDALKNAVLSKNCYEWKKLQQLLKIPKTVAVELWRQYIYPEITTKSKIAGSQRWSSQEDSIIIGYVTKNGQDWNAILVFLPGRSLISIEGRWRRLSKRIEIIKMETQKLQSNMKAVYKFSNKYAFHKMIVKQIAAKARKSKNSDEITMD